MKTASVLAKGLVMACLLTTAASADYYAGTADVFRIPGYFSGGGGEFTLYHVGPALAPTAYSPYTKNQLLPIKTYGQSFQSFCLEIPEHIMPPYHVNVDISTTNVYEFDPDGAGPINAGDVSGPGSHAVYGGADAKPFKPAGKTGDNLNAETAYLYNQFARGLLSNYEYTDFAAISGGNPSNRATEAAALQQAIWFLEGETITPLTGQALAWYNEAKTAVSTGKWSGIGSVRVINLWTVDAGGRVEDQSMLYLMPAPGAALLIGLGLTMVGWVKRRFA